MHNKRDQPRALTAAGRLGRNPVRAAFPWQFAQFIPHRVQKGHSSHDIPGCFSAPGFCREPGLCGMNPARPCCWWLSLSAPCMPWLWGTTFIYYLCLLNTLFVLLGLLGYLIMTQQLPAFPSLPEPGIVGKAVESSRQAARTSLQAVTTGQLFGLECPGLSRSGVTAGEGLCPEGALALCMDTEHRLAGGKDATGTTGIRKWLLKFCNCSWLNAS